MILLAAALLFAKGDAWEYTRTLRFENASEGIDYGEEERIEAKVLRADKAGYQLQYSRRSIATLIGSDRVPVPEASGEITTVDLLPSGHTEKFTEGGEAWSARILRIELSARDGLEQGIVSYLAQKKGLDAASVSWTATADPQTYRFTYKEGTEPDLIATGIAKFTPKTATLESLQLTCANTSLPTTGIRVILKVEQRRVGKNPKP